MSAEPQSDDNDELVHCDCGHEVPEDEVVSVPEVTLCERCYTPFDVTEWPKTIGKYEHRVHGRRGGTKTTNYTAILGLDERGRAVYYSGENNRILTFVPENNPVYQEDRNARLEELNEHRDRKRLRPRRDEYQSAGAGTHYRQSFITLPNGDHIVKVETSDKIKQRELREWMEENTGDWQQVHPDKVDVFDLEEFGTTSGKRTKDYKCKECGHTEVDMDPEDARTDGCPECGTNKFYSKTPN